MELDYKKLGKRIRNARLKKKMTQAQLAEAVELSTVYISHVESGTKLTLDTLIKICNILEVTPDYVLLDSIYTSKEYLKDELANLVKECSDRNMKTIVQVVKAILDTQKDL